MLVGKFRLIGLLLWMPSVLMAGSHPIRFMMDEKAGTEIQLDVMQSPLAPVLNEIAVKTGVLIHYSALPEGVFSASCKDRTVTEILKCLLDKKADVIFRYAFGVSSENQQRRPVEVWILAAHADVAQVAGGQPIEALSVATNTQTHSDDYLLELAAVKNPQHRVDAVAGLAAQGHASDPVIHDALEAALSDRNAEVRAQAVSGLVKNEGDDVSDVLQSALQDSDVSVRLMAVDNAGDNRAILQQALDDSDATVRAYAATKLEAFSGR